MKTIYNLQICRAIAAIIVLLAHANEFIDPNLFHGFLFIGGCGVDFFFVLSGFIIYYVNHKYIGVPAKFKQYIGKRLFRIYPIYWIYLFATIVLCTYFLHKNYDISSIIRSAVLYPFHTKLKQYPIIAPAHTLTYEVFFYVLFGISILTNRKIFAGIMGVWLTLIIANIFTGFLNTNNTLIDIIVSPFNIEFLYGCIIASLVMKNTFHISRSWARFLFATGLSLLSLAWVTQYYHWGILLDKQYLKFGIPFSLIIYAVALLENNHQQTMLKRLFVKLGDASYSIYLIHYIGIWFIMDFLFSRTPWLNSFSRLSITLVVLVTISYFAYKWIEAPLVKYLNKKLA